MWVTVLGVLAMSFAAPLARAADHQDGTAAKADPASDITDVFAWMNGDASKVYLVMDVFPAADKTNSKFSNMTKYVFHTVARKAYGSPDVANKVDIICTFDSTQKVSCWAVDKVAGSTIDYANGDASMTSGLMSNNGKMKIFTGPRDDPFFFNLDGFKDVAAFITQNKGLLTYDALGCPKIDAGTSMAAVKMLGGTMMGTMPPKDHFAGLNVLAIVIAVDKTILTDGTHGLVSVWAGTYK